MSIVKSSKPCSSLKVSEVVSVLSTRPGSIILGLVVGGAFLVLAFQRSSLQGVIETLQTLKPQFLLLGIGCYGLCLLARALRWRLLLGQRKTDCPVAVLFRAVAWGSAANTIVPQSGELLRSFVARKPLAISATSILGTIASERLYDFVTIIAFTAATLILFQPSAPILQNALLAICIMGVTLLTGLILVGFKVPVILRAVGLVTRLLPRHYKGAAQTLTNELSSGVRAALTNSHLIAIGILSIFQWLCIGGCIHLSVECLGLGLSPWLAFIVLPLTIAGLTLPTAPAYLGTMQMCFLLGLTPFGVSNEAAIAASINYMAIIGSLSLVSFVWYFLYVLSRKQAI